MEAMKNTIGEDGIDWKSMYFTQLDRANSIDADKRKYKKYHKDKDDECEELREHNEILSDKFIKELEENKELKLKIKALETSVKIYTENDAENIAEFCEMVNQDCNKLQEQIKIQKRMIKDLKECLDFTDEKLVKDLLIAYISVSSEDGGMLENPLELGSHYTDDEFCMLQRILDDINETDWNDDDCRCQFKANIFDTGIQIEIEIDDSDSDSD